MESNKKSKEEIRNQKRLNPNYGKSRYEINWDDPIYKGLSKKQVKKLARQNYRESTKDEWRKKKIEKSKLKKKQKRERGEIKIQVTNPIGKKVHRELIRKKIEKAPQIIIDASFHNTLNDKTLKSLVNQFCVCHALQRKSENPLKLTITGINDKIKELIELRDGKKWLLNYTKEDFLDFIDKEKVIYLSGDAEEEMGEFDPSKVYIIGGIVDRNTLKNITLEKSYKEKIKAVKFPLRKYVKLSGSPILTVNQCFEILLRLYNKEGWENTLLKTIPGRKAVKK